MSFGQKLVSGVAWTTAARVGQQALQFAVGIVLARMLLPEAYGLIGMVLVFTGFAALFAEFGFSAALVQRSELREEHFYSIFWINLLVGLLLCLLFVLASPLLARFYGAPLLESVTRWLSLSFIIGALGLVPTAILERRMAFRELAQVEVSAALGAGLLAILLALSGFGVWSLVVQSLTSSVLAAGLAWRLAGWSPKLSFSQPAVRDLIGFSSHLFGFTFVNYWARNVDSLLIGRIMGSSALGVYSRAYGLMLLPISQVINVISKVMFPALSSIQGDKPRVKRIYLRAVALIALVTFPMMVGLFVVAEPFVIVLLGTSWSEVVPVLQVLCIVGITQSLCSPTGWIYTSQGRTDVMFWWGIGGSGSLILSIICGAMIGSVEAVAWSYLVGNVLLTYPCIWLPGRLIGMSVGEVLSEVRVAAVCSAIMGAAVWGMGAFVGNSLPLGVLLSIQVSLGVISYWSLLMLIQPTAYRDILVLAEERLRIGSTPAKFIGWALRRRPAAAGR